MIWPAPAAKVPLRARLDVVPVEVVEAPTVQDAAVFMAGAAVTTGTVVLRNWSALADDPAAPVLRDLLASFGTYVVRSAEGLTCTSRSTSGHLEGISYDLAGAPGLAGVALVLAALADSPSQFTGLAEATRVEQVAANLTRLGANCHVQADVVTIVPKELHGGLWNSAADPVIAALGAVVALVVPDVHITGLSPEAPALQPFLRVWDRAMTADENILPGTSSGAVPYYT
nr:hypothetical protein [Kineosporia rhizophila]